VYDPLGRSYVEINANGGRTTTVFNAVGQTAALMDARGNRNSFTYDSTGAQTQLIDPLNRRTTSAYDAAGQQNLRIDARSNRTSFVYNTVGQLTNRKYPDGSRATLSYDTVGNRTLMADSTGRYTNVYDAVGQTTATASPNGQRQTFSYDTVGQRRSMDATGAGRSTYQYDAANQISSLLNPYVERTTFGYDDAGRRNVQRNANGTRVSLSYDAASQTTQVFHRTSAGASVLQLDYQYDNAGNRKSMAENVTAARTTWTYDKPNQLLGEYRTGTNPYRQTFTYDAASNRTLKNIDTVRTTYAYDVANQLKYGQALAGRTSFAYDATGNQRIEQPPAGNRTTTTWNFENQPTQYLLPAGSPVTMSYNGDNRRVISQQGATSTKFVWDATTDAYLSELDGTNAVQAVYTNAPQHYGFILSQRRSSTSHWLHADALGTTRLLTGSTQTTTDTYLLDAWGNPVTSSGTTMNPFQWVGRYGYYQDSSTGLVYVRARMYQPTVARWGSADPLLFVDGPNLYLPYFVPMQIDPSGTACSFKVCSSPVFGAGHLFIIVDGVAFRAGPGRSTSAGSESGAQEGEGGNPKCDCYGHSFGQLVGTNGKWDENFIDHPENPMHGYPENELICKTVNLPEAADCSALTKCLEDMERSLYHCCIPYQPTPVKGVTDGNSNSYIGWALGICLKTKKPWVYVPKDGRLNPGVRQNIPKCIADRMETE
jgi:RHS repeat-associated protein